MKAQGKFWAIVPWLLPLGQHFHHPSLHILFSTTPASHYLWQTQLFDHKHFLYLFQYSLRILLNTDNQPTSQQWHLIVNLFPPLTLRKMWMLHKFERRGMSRLGVDSRQRPGYGHFQASQDSLRLASSPRLISFGASFGGDHIPDRLSFL